jgi:hypothetical protein
MAGRPLGIWQQDAVMPNTLGLDDDLAPNELVAELEASFGFRFTNSELGSLRTVGDIFAVIRGRYAQTSDGANRCATAMAFYRIRRACAGFNARAKLTPDTRLDAFNTLTVKAFCKQIKARTGLRLPRLGFTPMGQLGTWCISAGFLAAVLAIAVAKPQLWPIPVLTAAAGIILVNLDSRRWPTGCLTLGDLAIKVAGLNFGKLRADGAASRDKDLWSAFIEVLSEHSLLPKPEIGPETRLLQKQIGS